MTDRLLTDAWPTVVDSVGGPDSGTGLNKDLFDAMELAIRDAIYDPDLNEGPPEIAAEVVAARGSSRSVSDRLAAVELAAAGGAATFKNDAHLNFIWNGGLFWSAGDALAPDGWTLPAGMTVARIAAQPTPVSGPATCYAGRNIIALTNSDATPRDFYFDVIVASRLSTHGNAPLAGASWAAGVGIYSPTVAGLVTVHLDDAAGSASQVGQQGSTVGSWVWSANGSYDGGRTLGAAPTRLRFIIRMTGSGTVYIAGPMCGPGGKSSFYVPPPMRRGQLVLSQGPEAALTTGVKGAFYVNRNMYLYNGRVIIQDHGGGTGCTVKLYKNAADLFASTPLTVPGTPTTDSGAKKPDSVQDASVPSGALLQWELSAVHASLRGVTLAVDYLEAEDLLDALFGGGVVF